MCSSYKRMITNINVTIIIYQMSLNEFTTLGKIGQGSYSSVHKVRRISDGQIYALKKVKLNNLKEKQKQNALNQVRLLASISNECIIGYKQAFFDSNEKALCIIMEYADGGDLQKIITSKKKSLQWVTQNQVWKMIKQITTALSVLHQMKIIHRDLKSANIFIGSGQYKLGDLNVSKLLKKALAYTQTGTPYYASPQVWKDEPYELKSDIWSFGCIIYEYCALKPPFLAKTMDGLYQRVLKGKYPRIPQFYSQKLQQFIDLCLKMNPKERPSAKELLKLIPDQRQEMDDIISNVNLLNTIKVPFNLHNLKSQLPKSNYDKISLKSTNGQSRFTNIDHHKLKEIVRRKQEEKGSFEKKGTPDLYPTIRKKLRNQSLKKHDHLPKIRMQSEPNEEMHLLKGKNEDRKKYQYNVPIWWG